MTKRVLICAAALVVLLAACGKDKPKTDATNTTRGGIAAKLAVDSRTIDPFGKVLTDADGHTLYIFDKDAATKPNSSCTGGCATTWPALTTSDGAGVGDGLDASKLTKNGTQYLYNGWPLYRFSGDTDAGQANGQGIGGVWHVAGADGNPVMSAAAATTTTAAATAKKTTATTAHTAATNPPATSPPTTPATTPATTATTVYSPY